MIVSEKLLKLLIKLSFLEWLENFLCGINQTVPSLSAPAPLLTLTYGCLLQEFTLSNDITINTAKTMVMRVNQEASNQGLLSNAMHLPIILGTDSLQVVK